MISPEKSAIGRYTYDPLDRLSSCGISPSAIRQQFYNNKHLATQVQGERWQSVFQCEALLLAQQACGALGGTYLLTTDRQRSVLNALNQQGNTPLAYSPYGYRIDEAEISVGFCGEFVDSLTGHYLLGNGYRSFNPILMRFNSPDSLSPFAEGGINAYMYCAGDPVDRVDPDGHAWAFISDIRSFFSTQPAEILSFKFGGKSALGDKPKGILKPATEKFKVRVDDAASGSMKSHEELTGLINKKRVSTKALRSKYFGERLDAEVTLQSLDKKIARIFNATPARSDESGVAEGRMGFGYVEVITFKVKKEGLVESFVRKMRGYSAREVNNIRGS